jgi:hypothetical protein
VNVYTYNLGMPRQVQVALARATAASQHATALIWHEVQHGMHESHNDWKLCGQDVLCCLLHYR